MADWRNLTTVGYKWQDLPGQILIEWEIDWDNNKAIKAYPRAHAHMHRDSDLRVRMSAAPGYSRHMSKKTTGTTAPAESTLPFRRRRVYLSHSRSAFSDGCVCTWTPVMPWQCHFSHRHSALLPKGRNPCASSQRARPGQPSARAPWQSLGRSPLRAPLPLGLSVSSNDAFD